MRGKRIGQIALLLLVALVASLGWLTYIPVRREQLNRALIAAIKRNDTKTALALLSQEANPNTRDAPPQHLSLWRLLLNKLRGKRPVPSTAPTALMVAIEISENTILIQALLDKDYASTSKGRQIIQMLKQAGVK